MKGREHLGDLVVDGRIILKVNHKGTGCELFRVTQDRAHYHAAVNTIMDLWVSYKTRNILTS
jgi:hypothetical protein